MHLRAYSTVAAFGGSPQTVRTVAGKRGYIITSPAVLKPMWIYMHVGGRCLDHEGVNRLFDHLDAVAKPAANEGE